MKEDIVISRKSFIKGAAVSGVAAMLAGSLSACAPKGEGTAQASAADAPSSAITGSFVGVGQGMGGEVRMEVTLNQGRITQILAQRNYETPGLTDLSFSVMPQVMVANQSYEVDVISGATVSGMAIKTAVKDALVKAGANVSEYAKKVEVESGTVDETIETEFVVVGGGGAGLCAAATFAEKGKNVVVVEKMPRLGGNTLVCGALMNAYDPIRTKNTAHANKTVQDFVEWTWKGGNEAGKMDLIETLCGQSEATTRWLVDEIGVIFYKDLQGAWGHMPELPNGTGFIYPLINKIDEFGVPCHLNSSLREILIEDGRTVGIVAEKANGSTLTVRASKGVVLATGGLGYNLEMVKELDSRYGDINLSTNPINATGECFAIAEDAGANLIHMDSIQAVHFADPATGQVDWDIETPNTIFVNVHGERFMNEEMPRDDSVAGLSEQPDRLMFTIGDSKDWPTMDAITSFGVTIGECLERKKAYKADTLEELAAMIGVDANGLMKTVSEYNAMIDDGVDAVFELQTIGTRSKIDQGPFYASKLTIAIHYTNGGIEINPQAQALDASGNVIPGLYAAGECAGGVMGTNRMGGNSVADVMVFGRIAGLTN